MTPMDGAAVPGQAVYTPLTLLAYDRVVLGLSNRHLWRCPTASLRALYYGNVGPSHLDVGVGTGYFLERLPVETAPYRITLLDLNVNSLRAAARRVACHVPRTVAANCLDPFPLQERFDSIGLCYLLHCLPGRMEDKARVFDHAAAVLSPDGTLFGATLLQADPSMSSPARALMALYNRRGIFSNRQDTEDALRKSLRARFADVWLERAGAAALFTARHPFRPAPPSVPCTIGPLHPQAESSAQ